MNYNDLEIQKGDVAQIRYAQMIKMRGDNPLRTKIAMQLKEYCKRDTLSMVALLDELLAIIGKEGEAA